MLNLTELDAHDPRHFRVVSQTNKYQGKWVVLRVRDGKVMTEGYDVFALCRWVKVWGVMNI